jgi:hypothetical protein
MKPEAYDRGHGKHNQPQNDDGHLLRPVSSSIQAYQEMLRGETAARGNSPMELHDAIGHFEQAVKLDPKFSIARGQV